MRVPGAVLMAAAVAANVVSRLTKIALPLSPYRLRSSLPLQNFDCRAAHEGLGWMPRIGTGRGNDMQDMAHPITHVSSESAYASISTPDRQACRESV